MKTIIVACGGGIATSATCATKINMALEERGLSNLAKLRLSISSHLIISSRLQMSMYPLPRCAVWYKAMTFR